MVVPGEHHVHAVFDEQGLELLAQLDCRAVTLPSEYNG